MPNTGLELRLFDAPHLRRDDEPLRVGARKALALLALLAAGGTTGRERLAATLWPDARPDAALRNLRQEIFRLRKFGAAPQAVADRCLSVPPQLEVDLLRFQHAIAAGDDATALAASSASLCDGLDGLAGIEFYAWLVRLRAHWLPQRQQARERLAEALEASGDLAGALALHRQALAEDGCAETAACAAIRLQVALGDRAAAAALLARHQRALRDELDLAPAAETVALATQLRLAAGPAGAAPERPAHGGPARHAATLPDRLPFIGRRAERGRIGAALRAGKRVFLLGVAGAGKTRLAAECGAERGPWLYVACAPTDPGLPYASALRVLRALRDAAPEVDLPAWVRRELAWLLPELGDGPPPVAGAEAGERLRAAFATAWTALEERTFDTIVLDDWHWADDSSIDLWQRVEHGNAAVIVAYRSAQLGTAALARMRHAVDQGAAVAVEIDGLSADETLGLVQSLAGATAGTLVFARRLHEASAGNPFHLIETLRLLAAQGRLRRLAEGRWSVPVVDTTSDSAALPVPASVREVVLGRVRSLGEATRRLLEVACLLGDCFDLRLLEGMTAVDADAIVQALEHARAARLIAMDENAVCRFAHDLVRQCLATSLSPARRQLLHARLARRLDAAGAEPALVAAQYEAAGEPGAAIGWRRQAADRAWKAHALAEAGAHYRQALADGASGGDAVAVRLALAEIERYRGDRPALRAALAAAVEAAADTDPETRLNAQLEQLRHWATVDRDPAVPVALDELATDLAAASAPLRARALQLRALLHSYQGQHDDARRLDEDAIALLDGLPQTLELRATLLDAGARSALFADQLERSQALARRAVVAAETAGDAFLLSRALVARGMAALYARNDRVAAEADYERARVLARRLGHVPQQRAVLLKLVKLNGDAGHADQVDALLDEGEALAPGFEHPATEAAFAEARYYTCYLRGDIDAARAAAQRLVAAARHNDDQPVRQLTYQLVVDLYLHTGDLETAQRLLDEAGDASSGLPHTVLGSKRAWLLLARGQPRAALAALEPLCSQARVADRVIIAWVGAASAIALNDLDGARAHLDAVDIAQDHVVDALAMLLVQRLRLARRFGRDDAAARARALDLLPRMPALEAAQVRAALAELATLR